MCSYVFILEFYCVYWLLMDCICDLHTVRCIIIVNCDYFFYIYHVMIACMLCWYYFNLVLDVNSVWIDYWAISRVANCHFVEGQLSFLWGGGMWRCLSYRESAGGYLLIECRCGVADEIRRIWIWLVVIGWVAVWRQQQGRDQASRHWNASLGGETVVKADAGIWPGTALMCDLCGQGTGPW